MTKNKSYLFLATWLIFLLAISSIIGVVTNAGKDDWYETLAKSSLTPPGWVFGVVWPILYLMIGVVGWRIWQSTAPSRGALIRLYIAQLFLNWGWSFAFFTFHQIALGYLWITVLALVVAVLIARLWSSDRMAAWLLFPYLAWLLFASYLSGSIWYLNP